MEYSNRQLSQNLLYDATRECRGDGPVRHSGCGCINRPQGRGEQTTHTRTRHDTIIRPGFQHTRGCNHTLRAVAAHGLIQQPS